MERISASEANRRFSRILADIRRGRRFVVTSHGRPVAWIVPAEGAAAKNDAGLKALLARLRKQEVVDIGNWRRDELYERQDGGGA